MKVSALKRLKAVLLDELVRVGQVVSTDPSNNLVTVELLAGGRLTVYGEAQVGERVKIKGNRIEHSVNLVEYTEVSV